VFLKKLENKRRCIVCWGNSIKAKDSPWYAVLSDLSVASTVDIKVIPFSNSVNILKVKSLIILSIVQIHYDLYVVNLIGFLLFDRSGYHWLTVCSYKIWRFRSRTRSGSATTKIDTKHKTSFNH